MQFDAPVLLYGAGREAASTRRFISERSPDTEVFVTVDSGSAEIDGTTVIAPEDLPAAFAGKRFGLIVKSPGVSRYKPVLALAREAGIPVTSNLNLWGTAYRHGRTVIAITGTKGKSTTATLTHLMLQAAGTDAGLAGNVGLAPLDIGGMHQTVVLELSSYQTADMNFLPDIAGITNLSPEHVDWHGSTANYYHDKLRLIDRDGPMAIALGAPAASNALVLSAVRDRSRLLPELTAGQRDTLALAARSSRLKGAHNLDNANLAARLAMAAGATLDGVLKGIAAFEPLPHRLEEHRIGNLLVVNDSISTTPEATKAALAAYAGHRIALIAGGHEREQDYGELATLLAPSGVTTLLCLPVTGERLAAAASDPGVLVETMPTLDAAMSRLAGLRDRFDAVILSPGAPSYPQYKNFEERGRHFVSLAEELLQ